MNRYPKISVALATYCGDEFLEVQLRSLLEQSTLPDELVISDDGSTDGTLEVVRRFKASAPFRVVVIEGCRLGFNKNFERAVSACSGEVILFCDQDDLWLPSHIHTLVRPFAASPSVAVTVSNSYYADADLLPIGPTLWSAERFDASTMASSDAFETFVAWCRHRALAGHGMAIRSNLREVVLPFGQNWVYDQWVGLIGAACGQLALIAEPLTIHRQHNRQSIGARSKSLTGHVISGRSLPIAYFDNQIEMWSELAGRLLSHTSKLVDPKVPGVVAARLDLLRIRRGLRQRGFIGRWARAVALLLSGAYHRQARGFLTFARDVVG